MRHVSAMASNDDHIGTDDLRRSKDLSRHVADRRHRARADPTAGQEPLRFVEQAPLPVALIDRRLDPSAHARLGHHVDDRHCVPGPGKLGGVNKRAPRRHGAVIGHEHLFHRQAVQLAPGCRPVFGHISG